MDPALPTPTLAAEASSWFEAWSTVKKVAKYSPLCCLGTTAVGGTGFGLAALFAAGTSALTPAAIASAAFDFFVTGVSLCSCGCYYKNMPEREFEENVTRQAGENTRLGTLERQIDGSVDELSVKNKQLTALLADEQEKAKSLQQDLDKISQNLLQSDTALNKVVADFNNLQTEFKKIQQSLMDSKQLVTSLMKVSLVMQQDIKASDTALKVFKQRDQEFKHEVELLDVDNQELSLLLKKYSQIISSEHDQFKLIITAYKNLDEACKALKTQLEGLSKEKQELAVDVKQDTKNIENLGHLADRLEHLVKDN